MEGGPISECANSYAISSIRILHSHLCIFGSVSSAVSQLRLVKKSTFLSFIKTPWIVNDCSSWLFTSKNHFYVPNTSDSMAVM